MTPKQLLDNFDKFVRQLVINHLEEIQGGKLGVPTMEDLDRCGQLHAFLEAGGTIPAVMTLTLPQNALNSKETPLPGKLGTGEGWAWGAAQEISSLVHRKATHPGSPNNINTVEFADLIRKHAPMTPFPADYDDTPKEEVQIWGRRTGYHDHEAIDSKK